MSPMETASSWVAANIWKVGTVVFAAGGFVAVEQHRASTYATKQDVREAIRVHEQQSEGRIAAIEDAADSLTAKLDALLYLQCRLPENRGDSVCRAVVIR